jgi:hypothetical protein
VNVKVIVVAVIAALVLPAVLAPNARAISPGQSTYFGVISLLGWDLSTGAVYTGSIQAFWADTLPRWGYTYHEPESLHFYGMSYGLYSVAGCGATTEGDRATASTAPRTGAYTWTPTGRPGSDRDDGFRRSTARSRRSGAVPRSGAPGHLPRGARATQRARRRSPASLTTVTLLRPSRSAPARSASRRTRFTVARDVPARAARSS